MNSFYNKTLGESWICHKHKSGLEIRIIKKAGKSRKCAMIATKFGSINREFECDGKTVVVPNGTAHFLEHKLFEGKDGNAFDFYAKTGAKANAFTSNDKTAYYFTCSSDFEKNLSILLSFVSNPYLTNENVEKEKGIIGQEIRMYEDEPSWQGYFGLVGCLYGTHPVKYDIAGSVEDIAPITVNTLMSCYNTFYDYSNMVLCISGDVDEQKILEICDEYLKTSHGKKINQIIPREPQGVIKEYVEKIMPVSRPIFYIGIKDNDTELVGYDLIKKEMEIEMLTEIMFGQSTSFYKKLYDSGIINADFDADYEMSQTFAFYFFAGESDEPEKVRQAIIGEIDNLFKNGITDERFTQVRNTVYGNLVASLDNVSTIVNMLVNSRFADSDPFDSTRALKEITKEDIMTRAQKLFKPLDIAMSVIKGE